MPNIFLILCAFFIALLNYGCTTRPQMLLDFSSGKEEVRSTDPLFNDSAKSMELVFVKGGCYQMGDVFNYKGFEEDPGEKPVHEVCLGDFYIGKYEVTQGQWQSVMGSNTLSLSPAAGGEKCLTCPVGNISWNEVQEFIGRLNSRSGGKKYRLPTEAEWEYAARSGGKDEQYAGGGNDLNKIAWYNVNSGNTLHPVGSKAPNGLGIYDMSGNDWEMTGDWYDSNYYANSPRNNPTGPDKPLNADLERVMRGGNASGNPSDLRTTKRRSFSERVGEDHNWSVGFRIVRIPDPAK